MHRELPQRRRAASLCAIPSLLTLAGIVLCAAEYAEKESDPQRLERVAKAGVETVLSHVLDVPVTVERVHLDPQSESLELENLHIGNPKGFEAEHALAFSRVRVEADPKRLFSRDPVVRLVEVGGAEVNAETNLARGNNLKRLLDAANRFESPKLLRKMPKKKWRIEKAALGKSDVNLVTNLLDRRATHKSLEPIEMKFMGPDGQGEEAQAAVARFLSELMKRLGLVEDTSAVGTILDLFRR